MPNRILIVTVMLAAIAIATSESRADRSVEDAVETMSSQILLPATPAGLWTFQICSGCNSQTVKLNEQSKFFVGSKQVSFDAMRQFANSDGPHSMTIFYRWTDQVLTRIVIDN